MQFKIILQINSSNLPINIDSDNSYSIREDDQIGISISSDDSISDLSLFFEDAEPEVIRLPHLDKYVYKVQPNRYFSECFGQAKIRIYIDEITCIIFLNVRSKKENVDAATSMVRYLAAHHESIIRSCFSRSTFLVGNSQEYSVDPETLIGAAESFVNSLLEHRTEFLASKKTRLIPSRQPLWKARDLNLEIDPIDVLNNLDAITPTSGDGDLFITGRNFSIDGIDVSTLQETSNVQENQILLGGLYSIEAKIKNLLEKINFGKIAPPSSDGYESLDRLLLNLTSSGMIKRCQQLIDSTNELRRLFESRIGVKYLGEIRPFMTPYVRTSKIYRALYAHLAAWYELGSPSLGASNFLIKLKSLDKIYELFSLFHIIEHMLSSDWEVIDIENHPDLGDFIPKTIKLKNKEIFATIFYEPIIQPQNSIELNNLDLVDVAHKRPGAEFNYWNPDYVVKLESKKGKVKYLIADAKYSTEYTVRTTRLPQVIEKYYWGMSVKNYNGNSNSNDGISGVLVIYPNKDSAFIGYGKRASIGSKNPPLPIVGAAGLSVDTGFLFNKTLDQILKIATNEMI